MFYLLVSGLKEFNINPEETFSLSFLYWISDVFNNIVLIGQIYKEINQNHFWETTEELHKVYHHEKEEENNVDYKFFIPWS